MTAFPKRTKSGPKHPERLSPAQFRDAVWLRDASTDRASGLYLTRAGDYPSSWLGEVHHLKGRNVRPEWKTDPNHAVLLSKVNHFNADGRGWNRLKLTDPKTGEPAIWGNKLIRFTMRDKAGNVLWERIS